MYEYEEEAQPLDINVLPNIDVQLDYIPIAHPVVPRLSPRRGHLFIWYSDKEKYPELYEYSQQAKGEAQWVNTNNQDLVEMGVGLFHIYKNEVIIGSLKTAGYLNTQSSIFVRSYIRKMWSDTITMFGDRKLVCPSGSMFEYIHLTLNQKRIPHEAYHREIMKQFGFTRCGDYWIR